jgi:hypothetical protein
MVDPIPLPIACTLAGASLEQRAAWLGRLGAAALTGAVRESDRLELRFRAAAADDVRELVRAERECCPFLEFRVRDAPDAVHLTVTGPPAATSVLDHLLAALRAGQVPGFPGRDAG